MTRLALQYIVISNVDPTKLPRQAARPFPLLTIKP